MGKIGGATIDLANNRSTSNVMRLLNEASPGSMKQFTEDYFTKDKMLLNKDTLEGKVERDVKDRRARSWSLRSLKESRESSNVRINKDRDRFNEQRKTTIIKQAKDAFFEGRHKDLPALGQKYLAYEGDPDTFVNELVGTAEKQKMSELKRQIFGAINNPTKMKRMVR